MSDLGRRAVACKAWRWMPGMLDCHGRRWLTESPVGGYPSVMWPATERAEAGPAAPDLTDPATRGCVVALLREVYRDRSLNTRCRATLRVHGVADSGMADGPWDVVATSEHVTIGLHGTLSDTEAEALVLALEAAR